MSSVDPSKALSQQEKMALQIGERTKGAEDLLMQAYSIKENEPKQLEALAKDLGVTLKKDADGKITTTARSLQLIAEQRYQNASQVYSLFSSLLDKIDQMKQRVISKMSN